LSILGYVLEARDETLPTERADVQDDEGASTST
jgi:hypothetical protein